MEINPKKRKHSEMTGKKGNEVTIYSIKKIEEKNVELEYKTKEEHGRIQKCGK